MVIRILDQNYYVQQTLPSEAGLVQYVCTNVSEDDGRMYRIVRIPLQDVEPALVEYLTDLYSQGLFRELVQFANEDGCLNVVLDCGKMTALPLSERLKGKLPLKERAMMGEKLLERLILSNIPAFFARGAMDTDHVCFTDAEECSLIFELENLPAFADAKTTEEVSRIGEVLAALFENELKDEKLPELKELLERIRQDELPGVMEIYMSYKPLAVHMAELNEETLPAMSLPFRIWEKIKKLFGLLKKLFFIVVILIAVGYLVMSVHDFMAPTVRKDIYESVGDIEILSGSRFDEDKETESAGSGSVLQNLKEKLSGGKEGGESDE